MDLSLHAIDVPFCHQSSNVTMIMIVYHLHLHQTRMVCIAYETCGGKLEFISLRFLFFYFLFSVDFLIIIMIADDSQLFMDFPNQYMLHELYLRYLRYFQISQLSDISKILDMVRYFLRYL